MGTATPVQANAVRIHAPAVTVPSVRPIAPVQISTKGSAFHSVPQNTIQPPPKKGAVLGRGLPPPIPPNKPVIATKQSVPRRSDGSLAVEAAALPVADKKKPSLSPPGKDSPKPHASTAKTEDQTATGSGPPHPPGIEMLGQELADFQQMFVTMATGNN